jgi:hypothetical protein
MAELAALSFANNILVDSGDMMVDQDVTPLPNKGGFHKVHGRPRYRRPPRPPDKDLPGPPPSSSSASGTTGTGRSGPFRSTAAPIVAFGDATFSSSMRGSAPSPNRKVDSPSFEISKSSDANFPRFQFQKALNRFIDSQRKDTQKHTLPTRIVAPRVVAIQEYHTSQLCRECHRTKLKQTRARECIIFGGNKTLWGVKCG